jgi:DNA modification methylase
MTVTLWHGDARDVLARLPEARVHTVVTSPPYYGLRSYDGLGPDQIGLEAVMDCLGWATGAPCGQCYVCHMVEVFRAVWRVLRTDGTLWLNLGDSYTGKANSGGANQNRGGHAVRLTGMPAKRAPGLKPKDLCGLPWRVALALQADGWWLRSAITLCKVNPMPESVTDRPAQATEMMFLLTKSATYYYDAEAVREPHAEPGRIQKHYGNGYTSGDGEKRHAGVRVYRSTTESPGYHPAGRTLRNWWPVVSESFSEAHFATFGTKWITPCIKAGTSAHGCCPACGVPWRRTVERVSVQSFAHGDLREGKQQHWKRATHCGPGDNGQYQPPHTTGWRPSCACPAPGPPVPCLCLDPFMGSGTTALVASRLGRDCVGVEASATYLEMARRRLEADAPLLARVEVRR